MLKLSYDLHIHSCLSPCGVDDMTPSNIIGMASIKKLDVIAVTDHNSCKNCPPVLKLAEEYGITVLPGMELCTQEEVHVLCLFAALSDALAFDEYVYSKLVKVPNSEMIFGRQEIYDEGDNVKASEPHLLINATEIPFHRIGMLMDRFHGIAIPAHIDKPANSLLSNLGFIPPDSKFRCAELSSISKAVSLRTENPYLQSCNLIYNSDAHSLWQIHEPEHFIESKSRNSSDILESLENYCYHSTHDRLPEQAVIEETKKNKLL